MRYRETDVADMERALAATPAPFVLDVRPASRFAAGHVPGSRNVPVHELARRRRELPPSKVARIVVVGEGGKRTEAAATWLALVGYADVSVLRGGIASWRGPIETGEPPTPART